MDRAACILLPKLSSSGIKSENHMKRILEITTEVLKQPPRMIAARWALEIHMESVSRSYNKVRSELAEVGLLADGVFLDATEVQVTLLTSLGEAGYVIEQGFWGMPALGLREGVIYLPGDLPDLTYVPGGTVTDTIRHEYAHVWHWLDPEFFERTWYQGAFSIPYDDLSIAPLDHWLGRMSRSRVYMKAYNACRTSAARVSLERKAKRNEFVSDYAATLSREDFAETFMTYLKYRKSLGRFKSRPGVYKKLLAVERAVKTARRELGL